ncbi:MAG: sulfur carrier protein ThiS adenylyltransferase ThiF [Candidatus Omnitrophica bacterium]|nr:sulfur carrier protein ThiS adenylyltransferase ThiF [Candidatus Omnitrophota bacterium]
MKTHNPFESSLLRYLTAQQLTTIQSQHIGIAGAGGLGSNIAVALVRTGFRHLTILDKDKVDASNLNRQDYTLTDIGKPKVKALKQRLIAINPDVEIMAHESEWTPQTADGFFGKCTILMEAFDQADIKATFVNWASAHAKHVISGNGMAGLMRKSPMTIKKIGNIYMVGDQTTSITDGNPPLAPRVVQCAAKMAEIVIDLTLDIPVLT